jgi:hypothetical protein
MAAHFCLRAFRTCVRRIHIDDRRLRRGNRLQLGRPGIDVLILTVAAPTAYWVASNSAFRSAASRSLRSPNHGEPTRNAESGDDPAANRDTWGIAAERVAARLAADGAVR